MRAFAYWLFLVGFLTTCLFAIPPVLNYAGQVAVNGEAFDGNGLFKFALVNDNGSKRIRVTDERNLERGAVGVCDSVAEAVKLFKIYADPRTKLF